MARRGKNQVTVRLEDDVLQALRDMAGVDRGRAGGIALYVRRLVYQDLGVPMPEQYGFAEGDTARPSLPSRVNLWLHPGPVPREEVEEAARLLAGSAGLEVLDPGEARRLRKEAAEAERLRKRPPAQPSYVNVPDFQEGRRRGLLEAAGLADELAGTLRVNSGPSAAERIGGLEAAADLARTLAEEIARYQGQDRDLAESVKGTRYADPSWLRSSAREWRRRLKVNPEDRDARLELGRVERIAAAVGVDLPDEPEPKRGRGRPRKS